MLAVFTYYAAERVVQHQVRQHGTGWPKLLPCFVVMLALFRAMQLNDNGAPLLRGSTHARD
jgi:hypothetical protein